MPNLIDTNLTEITLVSGQVHRIYLDDASLKDLEAANENMSNFKDRSLRLKKVTGFYMMEPGSMYMDMIVNSGLVEERTIEVDVAEIASIVVTKKKQIQWIKEVIDAPSTKEARRGGEETLEVLGADSGQ